MYNEDLLPAVHVKIGDRPNIAVIWLHGLGANGHDFEPIIPLLGLEDILSIQFIFPHAPPRPVTLNGGLIMPAWYDLFSLDTDGPEDETGILAAATQIENLLTHQIQQGIPSNRIVLMGFSQGGAIALHTGLRYSHPLAGIIGLSTYLPLRQQLRHKKNLSNVETPIFLAHGHLDQVLPVNFGLLSKDVLRHQGYSIEWHDYAMEHTICDQEIKDLRAWLIKTLPA